MAPSPSPSPSPAVPEPAVTKAASTPPSSSGPARHALLLFVNGTRVNVSPTEAQPERTLLDFLRHTMQLTGTKLGCGEGGCGACTVMVSKWDVTRQRVRHVSVNACLTPLCAMDACAITTVEGVGAHVDATPGALHPVQRALAEAHGSQCGYCTPGFVMALFAMVKQRETGHALTMDEIAHGLDGNLCRCTGYRPILDAARAFGSDALTETAASESASVSVSASGLAETAGKDTEVSRCKGTCPGCPNQSGGGVDIEDLSVEQVTTCSTSQIRTLAQKYGSSGADAHADAVTSSSSVSLFPEELQQQAVAPEYLQIQGDRVQWFAPVTMAQLLALKATHPTAKIAVGNTEMGIETKFKGLQYPHLIHVARVRELTAMALVASDDAIHTTAAWRRGPRRGQLFEGVKLGGAASLSDVKQFLSQLTTSVPATQRHTLTAITSMLQWFASTHIRNVACLAGNLATASPISDMNPLLAAMNAVLELRQAPSSSSPSEEDASVAGVDQGQRFVCVRDFFLGYRKVDLQPKEVITSVYVPFSKTWEYMLPFKQAKRREDDISIVTAGIRMALAPAAPSSSEMTTATTTAKAKDKDNTEPPSQWVITDASLVYGGMAPITKPAEATERALIGQPFTRATIENACETLHAYDFNLPLDVPGGMARYRESLCASFLFKFFIATSAQLHHDVAAHQHETSTTTDDGSGAASPSLSLLLLPPAPVIARDEQSARESFLTATRHPRQHGVQTYGRELGGLTTSQHTAQGSPTTPRGPVGDPLMHKSAYLQVTGEAEYTDDIATTADTLHAALVLSTCAHGRIRRLDASKALAMPGVHRFLDASIFTSHRLGSNKIGPVFKDEECFASETVVCVGQPVGLIVADTHEQAMLAANAVVVEYDARPAILTIQDAITAQSFFQAPHVIDDGDVERGLAESDVVIEGEFAMGGQEQFYFETNVSLCIPQEGGQSLKVISSTQAATKTQVLVARVLGLDESRVSCTTRRIGGGFGGKETRSVFVSCVAAVAAQVLRRPVKCLLERHVDMLTTGGRHPFYAKYKLGATKEGLLRALDVQLFNNGGYSMDLSQAVMDRALFHCDNSYQFPHLRATGTVCRTNMPTNTAFRGFGGPQGLMVAETYMDHLARELRIAPHELRLKNMYRQHEVTHFGQPLVDFTLRALWAKALTKSRFADRQREVAAFNKQNRWKKRGVSVVPCKFGISFTAKFMNQGGALVHVYTDGSVLVSHGGVEMGQGLHTKVIQVAARAFGIPHERVRIEETCTTRVANSQPSAASMSTDLYGMATLDACEQILARLAPVRQQLGGDEVPFTKVVQAAYMNRIDLSAHGFYIVPHARCGYDFAKSVAENAAEGTAFNYFTTGVACTEVELDVLTGDFHMRSVDIAMDLGASINPAIDIGQIEGAFMQGFGLFALEELVWGDDAHPWVKPGHLFTRGPGAYKIPSMNDLPTNFHVWLESDRKNPFAVHSSKAVGEPPLFLGASAFFAAKEAIYSAREDAGLGTEYFVLQSPVTPERARMACGDHVLQKLFTARGEDMASFLPRGSF